MTVRDLTDERGAVVRASIAEEHIMAAIFLQGYVRIQSDYLWLSLRRMSTINLSHEIRLSDWPARSGTRETVCMPKTRK